MSNIRNIEAEIDAMIEEDDEFNGVDNSSLEEDNDTNGEDDQGSKENEVQPSGENDKTVEGSTDKGAKETSEEGKPKKAGGDFVDAKGNVVDANGKIIAKAGSERRLHVEKRQAEARATTLGLQLEEANKKLEQAQIFADLPKNLGVSPEEYGDGLKLMKLFKADPVAAAKEVVARAMALGHNVTDILGAEVGNSVDMMALRRHSEEMANRPIREREEQNRRQEESQRQGQIAYNNFISQYPDADIHGDAIAHQMQTQGVSAETAYLRIQNFALANGLDFSEPLGPQIEARTRANISGNQVRQDQPSARRPAPMGNGNGGRVSDQQLTDKSGVNSADDSWADILRDAMKG